MIGFCRRPVIRPTRTPQSRCPILENFIKANYPGSAKGLPLVTLADCNPAFFPTNVPYIPLDNTFLHSIPSVWRPYGYKWTTFIWLYSMFSCKTAAAAASTWLIQGAGGPVYPQFISSSSFHWKRTRRWCCCRFDFRIDHWRKCLSHITHWLLPLLCHHLVNII